MSTDTSNPRQFAAAHGSVPFDLKPAAGSGESPVRSGAGGDEDWRDSEEYQAFLSECAKHCRCTHSICDGVLAGGLCDEIIEDDSDEENYPRDEDDDY